MPAPVLLLSIAALLPLAAFVGLLFAGKRLGDPLAGVVGAGAISFSFILSLLCLFAWINGGGPVGHEWGYGHRPIDLQIPWIAIAPHSWLTIGVYIDSLTVAMFNMVATVAAAVFMFSLGYMHHDERFARFFTYLSLFCFAMFGLVLAGNLLQMFIFWELVGVCSYLLIGFWYEKSQVNNAALKAFVVNRVGDIGFLVAIGIIFWHVGNLSLPRLWIAMEAGGPLAAGSAISAGLLTLAGIGFALGAMGKSAQFPLMVWLPDAMEGPTPVSALIHAATMVAAGIFLLARVYPLLTPDARLFIAIIGTITLTLGALIALVQTDIKRVLAYSTISQLGYMMLALGVGSYTGALFHLITHAFFKSLLFLGAGSVIAAAGHEQEMGRLGGLFSRIPMTGATFLVAVLAISGAGFDGIGFSGYYSKDLILTHCAAYAIAAIHAGHGAGYWLLFFIPAAVAYVTAFYMTRCWALIFIGRPRDLRLHQNASETPLLWLPLALLAILSIIAGSDFFGVRSLIDAHITESQRYCDELIQAQAPNGMPSIVPASSSAGPSAATAPAMIAAPHLFHGFDQSWPHEQPVDLSQSDESDAAYAGQPLPAQVSLDRGDEMVQTWAQWAFIGIGLGLLLYGSGDAAAKRMLRFKPLAIVHHYLYEGLYLDEMLVFLIGDGVSELLAPIVGWFDRICIDGIVASVVATARGGAFLAGWCDRNVIDNAVSGAADLAQDLGTLARAPQTGRIRLYVTVLLGAVTLAIATAIIVAMQR